MNKFSLILALIFSSFVIVSCGSDSDDDDSSAQQQREDAKNLFSVWRQVDEDLVLDFRNMSFDTNYIFQFSTAEGLACTCNLEIDGNQTSGDIFLRNCSGIEGCFSLIDTYSYDKDADSLRICDSRRDCDEYR